MHSFMQIQAIVTQFQAIFAISASLLFQPFLDQFQHIGYQNACATAEKFNCYTFMHITTLPHAISCNFHAISYNFGYFGLIST